MSCKALRVASFMCVCYRVQLDDHVMDSAANCSMAAANRATALPKIRSRLHERLRLDLPCCNPCSPASNHCNQDVRDLRRPNRELTNRELGFLIADAVEQGAVVKDFSKGSHKVSASSCVCFQALCSVQNRVLARCRVHKGIVISCLCFGCNQP